MENDLPIPITRRGKWWTRGPRTRRGFVYTDARGCPVTDDAALARIAHLAIPPAWTNVRICPSTHGSLQAIGIDGAGRIQYRYSERFIAEHRARKFAKLIPFGEKLPALRAETNRHLAVSGAAYDRTLAVAIRLVESLYFRVGSDNSVERYKTFGLTTLQNRHVHFEKGAVSFSFVGKHHIRQRRLLADAELVDALREIQALRGRRLLQYRASDGSVHPIHARDINAYLRRILGDGFSAKDFRTWGGTLEASRALAEIGPAETLTRQRKNVVTALRRVADVLGNTPAVCRSAYVHPTVLTRYADGITLADVSPRRRRRLRGTVPEDDHDERALLSLLAE